jgi:hypothetical protein
MDRHNQVIQIIYEIEDCIGYETDNVDIYIQYYNDLVHHLMGVDNTKVEHTKMGNTKRSYRSMIYNILITLSDDDFEEWCEIECFTNVLSSGAQSAERHDDYELVDTNVKEGTSCVVQ